MIGELGELVEWLLAAIAGWRFIFSPAYRRLKIEEWRDDHWSQIVWDVVCGVCGIVFSLLIAYGVWFMIRSFA